MHSRRRFLRNVAILSTTASATVAWSQSWPARTIKLVVPFPPGGGTDRIARILATELARILAQQVVVENVPGASGAIGTSQAMRSAPDGYTLLLGFPGALVITPLVAQQAPYDARRDVVAIGGVATYAAVLAVAAEFPTTDLRSYMTYGASRGKSVSVGTSSVASQISMDLLRQKTTTEFLYVPYKGEAPLLTDILGRSVESGMVTVVAAEPFIRNGQLKALAIAARRRSPRLPDVPTFAEAGYPDRFIESWAGLFAPKATPTAVIQRVGEALDEALKQPGLQREFMSSGFAPWSMTPEALSAQIRVEYDRYKAIIAAGNYESK